MKKIILVSLLLLCITTNIAAEQASSDELIDLANYITDREMTIDGWQMTIKEQVDRNKIGKVIKELKNSYLLTINREGNNIKYSFSTAQKNESIVESYTVIIPKEKKHEVELIGVLKGENWSEAVKESYDERLSQMLHKFFSKSAKRFACLTTTNDAIIDSDYFISEFLNVFNVQHITTQFDTVENALHKKIIYGYTPLWSEKITIVDSPMNLQLAVKENEIGNQTYTIGTPILINEY